MQRAPNAVDREEALNRMLAGIPSDASVHVVVEALRKDFGCELSLPEAGLETDVGREARARLH